MNNTNTQLKLINIDSIELQMYADPKILLSAALRAAVDGMIVINSDRKIIAINDQFAEIWDIEKDQNTDYNLILKLISAKLRESKEFIDTTNKLFEQPGEWHNQILLLNDERAFEWFSKPFKTNDVIIGLVWSFRDVTSLKIQEDEIRKHLEEMRMTQDLIEQNAFELVQLNLKLEESETKLQDLIASKDKFFSIIAHDLKSPFTGLVGFTQMLVEDFDDFNREELKEFLTSLNRSAKQTFNLLENLLEWARIQSGRINFQPLRFDFYEVCESVLDLFNGNAQRKKITFNNSIDKNVHVFADSNMINTVLRNLLSNAIKFTQTGGEIELSAEEDDGYLYISVRDSGVGMNQEEMDKLFRIDIHHTKRGTENEKGTGLGLILCDELIRKNGGIIRVESQLNIGTTFIFSLPKG